MKASNTLYHIYYFSDKFSHFIIEPRILSSCEKIAKLPTLVRFVNWKESVGNGMRKAHQGTQSSIKDWHLSQDVCERLLTQLKMQNLRQREFYYFLSYMANSSN